jgi:hypothetical protein
MCLHPFQTDNAFKTTGTYSVMMWNKFEFIYKAFQLFPDFDHYVWVDFGIQAVVSRHAHECSIDDAVNQFVDDKFCCMIINPLVPSEYNDLGICYGSWKYRQVGGFWSIGRKLVDFFILYLRNEIDKVLTGGYVCMDEEVMARFSYVHPEKCKFSFGDYASCIINWTGLKHDLPNVRAYVDKLHFNGRHVMASAGLEQLLESYTRGWIPWSDADVFALMLKYYIETYYVNTNKARQIVMAMIHTAHHNDYARNQLLNNPAPYRSNFCHVISDKEMNDWFPQPTEPLVLVQLNKKFT